MIVAPRTRGKIQGELVSHEVERVFLRSPGSLGYIPLPEGLALWERKKPTWMDKKKKSSDLVCAKKRTLLKSVLSDTLKGVKSK